MPKIIKSVAFHNGTLFGKPQRNYEHNYLFLQRTKPKALS